jgi:hypothetical protein
MARVRGFETIDTRTSLRKPERATALTIGYVDRLVLVFFIQFQASLI